MTNPTTLSSYIDLVDESGRCVRDDKRRFIAHDSTRTIDQLGISSDTWIGELKGFKSIGFSAVGTAQQLKEYSAKTYSKWKLDFRLKPAIN